MRPDSPSFTNYKRLGVGDSQPFVGGKTGIRTLGTRKGTTVFETVPIDRSGIFPWSFASAKVRPIFELCKYFGRFFVYFFSEAYFAGAVTLPRAQHFAVSR